MPIGTGPAAAAMAILTAIRARNQSALEEARARREDQDFALRQAAQQAAQRNAAMQTEMQRTNNLINLSREQRAVQKENESSINAARSQFLSDMDPYTKSKERGVPEAVAPMAAEARKWVDYAPEYAKPGNPMHDTLDAQLKSDMEPMAAKAAEVAAQNQQNELAKKATGPVRPTAGPKATAPKDISDKVGGEIKSKMALVQGLDDVVSQAGALKSKFPGYWEGKQPVQEIRRALGMQDPEVAAYLARVEDLVSARVKERSGAAYTMTEKNWLASQMPNAGDSLPTLMAKASNIRRYERWKIGNDLRDLRARNRNIGGYEKEYGIDLNSPEFAPTQAWTGGNRLVPSPPGLGQ